MASKKIHPLVRDAVTLAQMAGWSVDYKDDTVKIGIPGLDEEGKSYPPLTVDLFPNELTLEKWRATARTYKLEMPGPASTPWEREKAAKEKAAKAEAAKAQTRADSQEKQRQIAAVKARQAAEIEAGRNAPAGLFSQPVVAEPLKAVATVPAPAFVQPVPAKKEKSVAAATAKKNATGFPAFQTWMLTASKEKLQLTEGSNKGQYFCPECLRDGEEFAAKLGQGLAAHRGYKHARFAKTQESTLVTNAVLPENVLAALEMLSGEIAETLARSASGPEVAAKDTKIVELTEALRVANASLAESKAKFDSASELASGRDVALNEAQQKITDLQAKLDRVKSDKESLEAAILQGFEVRLREMRTFAQTLSPVQAVGKIDEKIGELLED